MDRGTLFQLRNLIRRRNVPTKCKEDTNSCEDFLTLVVTGHIISAAMVKLGMSAMDEIPQASIVPPNAWMLDDEARKSILMELSASIVEEHVDLAKTFKHDSQGSATPDRVYFYAQEILSLGLLYMELCDAVKQGDGERLMLVWKYLLPVFKASNRVHYSNEALSLLCQVNITLPPQLANQVKWSRFINVHGRPGHNISCDLHMEHMNRIVKTCIQCLGANKSEKAIVRAGKSMITLMKVLEQFDQDNGVERGSGSHTRKQSTKDLLRIVQQLVDARVFKPETGRKHASFPHFTANVFNSLDEKQFKEWMIERFSFRSLH